MLECQHVRLPVAQASATLPSRLRPERSGIVCASIHPGSRMVKAVVELSQGYRV